MAYNPCKPDDKNLMRLVTAINRLPELEMKMIFLFHFVEPLTLSEISEVMNLTESHASFIHGKAILSLRSAMGRR